MPDQKKSKRYRVTLIGLSLSGLVLVYFCHRLDYLNFFFRFAGFQSYPNLTFIFNKTFRLILNDLLCFVLIHALFQEKKYLKVAFLVFCFELFFILPAYLTIKLY